MMHSRENVYQYVANWHSSERDVTFKYEKIAKIGQGTFGEVFKAKLRNSSSNNQYVALKKVLTERETEGFPITALREIKILQQLHHENVVKLIEVCNTRPTAENHYRGDCFLVLDYCDHDLAGLLGNQKVCFSFGHVKMVMKQILNGLFYIQCQKVLHRDMKPSNVLVTKDGTVKLADFGISRHFSAPKPGAVNRMTNKVTTLWYRPPELLLGERNYNHSVDIWGVGCIMAEMWTRRPIMRGSTEQQQLTLISHLCGSITPEIWPGVEELPLYSKLDLPKHHKRNLQGQMQRFIKNQEALNLMDQMLQLDPLKRCDAEKALDHEFFWTDPMPCELGTMLGQLGSSMFQYLQHRKEGGGQGAAGKRRQVGQAQDSGYQDRIY